MNSSKELNLLEYRPSKIPIANGAPNIINAANSFPRIKYTFLVPLTISVPGI